MELIRKAAPATKANGKSWVLSDETPDRLGDVILSDGWQLEDFKKNPITLWGHDASFPPVGTWQNLRIEKKSLVADLQLAPKGTSERIDEIARLVEANIIRAASVGFRPIERKPRMVGDKQVGETYVKHTLVETSLVAIPANPNALAIMKSLNISDETRKLVFAMSGDDDKPIEFDHLGELAKLTELERWSPAEAAKAKRWADGFVKTYPNNPFYRKVYRLFDEMETVRTISLVIAVSGTKDASN
jgi:HK97 family phage prohead protease